MFRKIKEIIKTIRLFFKCQTYNKSENEMKHKYDFTLSSCIPPALDALITKIKDNALGRYSLSLCVTSPDPPMPGVSTRIVFACLILIV